MFISSCNNYLMFLYLFLVLIPVKGIVQMGVPVPVIVRAKLHLMDNMFPQHVHPLWMLLSQIVKLAIGVIL